MKYTLVTVSDHRKNLSAHLKRMREGEIFEVGGLLLTDIRTLGPNYEKGAKSLEDKIYAAAHAGKAETIIFHGDGTQEIIQEVDGKAAKFLELKKQLDVRQENFKPGVSAGFGADGYLTSDGTGLVLGEVLPKCEKCKQPSECRKMYEEGVEHVICMICALKAKLPWNKLEKL